MHKTVGAINLAMPFNSFKLVPLWRHEAAILDHKVIGLWDPGREFQLQEAQGDSGDQENDKTDGNKRRESGFTGAMVL